MGKSNALTQKQKYMKARELIDKVPWDEMDEVVTKIKTRYGEGALCELEEALTSTALEAGKIAQYLMYRGAAGCGDHGHHEAFEQACTRATRLRKALGYSYP